jgi:hypothetical protein
VTSFNEMSFQALRTLGSLKYSGLYLLGSVVPLNISELATMLPEMPPPTTAATAATASAIFVDMANPNVTPAVLATTAVAPVAADMPATLAAFTARYCVIILL